MLVYEWFSQLKIVSLLNAAWNRFLEWIFGVTSSVQKQKMNERINAISREITTDELLSAKLRNRYAKETLSPDGLLRYNFKNYWECYQKNLSEQERAVVKDYEATHSTSVDFTVAALEKNYPATDSAYTELLQHLSNYNQEQKIQNQSQILGVEVLIQHHKNNHLSPKANHFFSNIEKLSCFSSSSNATPKNKFPTFSQERKIRSAKFFNIMANASLIQTSLQLTHYLINQENTTESPQYFTIIKRAFFNFLTQLLQEKILKMMTKQDSENKILIQKDGANEQRNARVNCL